jgi:hypothetical protein
VLHSRNEWFSLPELSDALVARREEIRHGFWFSRWAVSA